MKKIALSFLVVVVFIAYVLHQKGESDDVHVIAPASLQNTPTPSDSAQIVTPTTSASGGTPPEAATPTVAASGKYKDGLYTSEIGDAFYGPLQIKVIISGGKITDVVFLQYPNDRDTSREINSQAMPLLKQEAIAAQSAQVDVVSGATQTSEAFKQILKSTLADAKA